MFFPRPLGAFDRLLLARAVQPFLVFQVELKRYALEVLDGDQPEAKTGEIGEAGETDTSSSLISVFHSFTTFENHWTSLKYRFNASPHLLNLLASGAAGSQL